MNSYYPVFLTVYNRKEYTRRVVEALANNTIAKETDLYIFADGAKQAGDAAVLETRAYLKTITGFKSVTIVEWDNNKNCALSTIDTCNYMCKVAEAFIGLVDDIETHPYFLQYMNDALNYYKDVPEVATVMGYCHQTTMRGVLKNYPYDVFFGPAWHDYGWGTWRDRWQSMDVTVAGAKKLLQESKRPAYGVRQVIATWFHGLSFKAAITDNNELWDMRTTINMYCTNRVAVWPKTSYTRTFGFEAGSGLHSWTFPDKYFNFSLDNVNTHPVFVKPIKHSFWFNLKMTLVIGPCTWVPAFIANFFSPLLKKKISHRS